MDSTNNVKTKNLSENLNNTIFVILSIVFSSTKDIVSDRPILCNCVSESV